MKKKSEAPRSFSELIDSNKNRPVPDIPYFAQRGGLSPVANPYPYQLFNELLDHVHTSNGTPTVQYHLVRGLEKYYFDLQTVQQDAEARGVEIDEKALRQLFPKLDFVEGPLPIGTPQECAEQTIEQHIHNRWPVLKEYPPKKSGGKGRSEDPLRRGRLDALRVIYRDRPDASVEDVVHGFDQGLVRLLPTWMGKGVKTWREAFSDSRFRKKVQNEIYTLRAEIQPVS